MPAGVVLLVTVAACSGAGASAPVPVPEHGVEARELSVPFDR
ncbi:hypothetical protein ACFFR3_36565 [Nonomuraea salmonea]|uniref:Uncharacterized protein n=1 Tax=Nonomuraea salmonea TaxID=46181 RepID=A0ABV5NYP6_9ACTN